MAAAQISNIICNKILSGSSAALFLAQESYFQIRAFVYAITLDLIQGIGWDILVPGFYAKTSMNGKFSGR